MNLPPGATVPCSLESCRLSSLAASTTAVRDLEVTRVQSFALKVLLVPFGGIVPLLTTAKRSLAVSEAPGATVPRSEERRVGKECRSQGVQSRTKKKSLSYWAPAVELVTVA